MNLPVKIDSGEVAARSQELAESCAEMDELEDEKKKVAASFRELIIAKRSQIKKLAAVVESGQEDRPVKVEYVAYYLDGRVDTIRTDTGEVVSGRPLTDEERQPKLVK